MIVKNKFYGKTEARKREISPRRETLRVVSRGKTINLPAEMVIDHHRRVSEWVNAKKKVFRFY